jgi:Holliday junction resolvasome RuvABC DNA-binding subunit
VPSLVVAGLPIDSVKPFLAALSTGNLAAVEKVPGVNAKIIQTGITELTEAYAEGFKLGTLITQPCLLSASY